jgi:pimeloyl-ACP methyl ester carboxylesterase
MPVSGAEAPSPNIKAMPYVDRPGGVKIHWEQQGSGPLVVLAPYANGYPSVYEPLAAELLSDHRVVRYDDRGTGLSDRTGPFDMETGADDLEAVIEEAAGPAVVITLADAVHRAARVTARRPDLVEALVCPGGSPAGRLHLEGTDAMVASDSVLDAFMSMGETDYRGALRSVISAANPQMSEDEVRERVRLQIEYQPQEAIVARWRAWAEDDTTDEGRECGDRLWILYSENMSGGWFPSGDEARRIAERLFPQAHVEEVDDGMISRPDQFAGIVRRITAKARSTTV